MKNIYPNIYSSNLINLKKAKKNLENNNIIGVPTETVYGLAGNAYSDKSVKKIFKLKKRPSYNPLIIHYRNLYDLRKDVIINANFLKLYKALCPGPITFILNKNKKCKISKKAMGGKKTVAVRIPSHKVVRKLLNILKFPLAAPSANISSKLSPTSAKDVLDEFGKKRVIDTPISELGFSGIGVGSTMTGNRPIIEFMTFNFALVGIDQIINNAAKIRQMSGGQFPCPIVFRGPTGSAGQLAATHSQAFESWYANCPGLKVIVPSNPYDAKGLLKSAIRDDDPVIFMESEQMYGDKGEVPEDEYLLPIGVADIKRKGEDVTIVSFGKIIKEAYKAAEILVKENISCEIIDIRTIRPLDYNTIIESVKKTNRLVILEESWPFGNISTEISYQVQNEIFDYLDAPIEKINTADTPAPFSPVLLEEWLPNSNDVIKSVKKVLYRK